MPIFLIFWTILGSLSGHANPTAPFVEMYPDPGVTKVNVCLMDMEQESIKKEPIVANYPQADLVWLRVGDGAFAAICHAPTKVAGIVTLVCDTKSGCIPIGVTETCFCEGGGCRQFKTACTYQGCQLLSEGDTNTCTGACEIPCDKSHKQCLVRQGAHGCQVQHLVFSDGQLANRFCVGDECIVVPVAEASPQNPERIPSDSP